jgi:hypothetical protein
VKGDQSDADWLCVALQDLGAGVSILKAGKRVLDALESVRWP